MPQAGRRRHRTKQRQACIALNPFLQVKRIDHRHKAAGCKDQSDDALLNTMAVEDPDAPGKTQNDHRHQPKDMRRADEKLDGRHESTEGVAGRKVTQPSYNLLNERP